MRFVKTKDVHQRRRRSRRQLGHRERGQYHDAGRLLRAEATCVATGAARKPGGRRRAAIVALLAHVRLVVQRVAVGVLQIAFLRKLFYYCSASISTRARRAGDTARGAMPTAGCCALFVRRVARRAAGLGARE